MVRGDARPRGEVRSKSRDRRGPTAIPDPITNPPRSVPILGPSRPDAVPSLSGGLTRCDRAASRRGTTSRDLRPIRSRGASSPAVPPLDTDPGDRRVLAGDS